MTHRGTAAAIESANDLWNAEPGDAVRSPNRPSAGTPENVLVVLRDDGDVERRQIPAEGLSLRGAAIRWDGGRPVLVEGAAPVRLNGERLRGERALQQGDVIRSGRTLLVYAPRMGAGDPDLVGSSAALVAVRKSVDAVAARRHAVVITGETGTGKEVVARMLHDRSGRSGPFIAVNCSTFTETLLPSELFGHVRGAFTGAMADHLGLFRACRGGTLLLDELADIPMPLQASLLRVLETHTVRPVGSTKDVPVDARIVATSNRELVDLVQSGRFRADLYARLAQWTIRLPALRQRREDLPELIAHLLPRADGAGRRIDPDLGEALLLHEWPLNVRGLLNVLSIAVISAEDEDAPLTLTPEVEMALWTTRATEAAPSAPAPWEPPATLSRGELEDLLTRFRGHVAAAARHAGMTRPKLYRLLSAYELDPDAFRAPRPGL